MVLFSLTKFTSKLPWSGRATDQWPEVGSKSIFQPVSKIHSIVSLKSICLFNAALSQFTFNGNNIVLVKFEDWLLVDIWLLNTSFPSNLSLINIFTSFLILSMSAPLSFKIYFTALGISSKWAATPLVANRNAPLIPES